MQNSKYIKTKTDQTVFDLAIQEYGNANAIFQLLADNSSLLIDAIQPVNTNVLISLNFKAAKENFDEAKPEVRKTTKDGEYALENQNIFDICLQEFGTIEAIFDFMTANNIEGLNYGLIANARYKLPVNAKTDNLIKTQYTNAGIKVVTGIGSNYRITEENVIRKTEEGTIRIIE